MKQQEVEFGKAVALQWVDSSVALNGWVNNPNSIEEVGAIKSLGFVVASSPRQIVISSSLNDRGGAINPLVIPWACVEKLVWIGPEWDQ